MDVNESVTSHNPNQNELFLVDVPAMIMGMQGLERRCMVRKLWWWWAGWVGVGCVCACVCNAVDESVCEEGTDEDGQ